MTHSSRLRALLRCPACHGELEWNDACTCVGCGRAYGVVDGVPVLVAADELPREQRAIVRYYEREGYLEPTEPYTLLPWQTTYLDRFRENFAVTGETVVIDCGTGPGYMAVELAKQGVDVIACDLTLPIVLRIRRLAEDLGLDDRLLAVCCSIERLPFASAVADYVTANGVLVHLRDDIPAIREIVRVCRDDAGVMLSVANSLRLVNPLLLPAAIILDRSARIFRHYDIETLSARFSGWTLLRVYYTGHLAKGLRVLFNRFVWNVFDEGAIERRDARSAHRARGGSNFVAMFRRGVRDDGRPDAGKR